MSMPVWNNVDLDHAYIYDVKETTGSVQYNRHTEDFFTMDSIIQSQCPHL